jgi:hypothetical protein
MRAEKLQRGKKEEERNKNTVNDFSHLILLYNVFGGINISLWSLLSHLNLLVHAVID